MDGQPSVMDVLIMWREAELERRRWLLAELGHIERRWGLGQHQGQGAAIFRLNTQDGSGTSVP